MPIDTSHLVFPWERKRSARFPAPIRAHVSTATKEALARQAEAEQTTVAQIVRRTLDAALRGPVHTSAGVG